MSARVNSSPDVGLQRDGALRAANRLQHLGEDLLAVDQRLHLVSRKHLRPEQHVHAAQELRVVDPKPALDNLVVNKQGRLPREQPSGMRECEDALANHVYRASLAVRVVAQRLGKGRFDAHLKMIGDVKTNAY